MESSRGRDRMVVEFITTYAISFYFLQYSSNKYCSILNHLTNGRFKKYQKTINNVILYFSDFHVESYIRTLMNYACRMEIMTWIESMLIIEGHYPDT
jgi:hypothetical protein